MAAPVGISNAIEGEILEKAASGLRSNAISEWLFATHGITISASAIRKRVQGVRLERREVTQAAAVEALTRVVLSDLDVLEAERRRARKLATKLYKLAMTDSDTAVNGEAAELYLKALDRVTKLVDMRLHYAGVDADIDPEAASDEQLQELVKKAVKVLEKR